MCEAVQERVRIEIWPIKIAALFLEGIKIGRGGDILPFGTIAIDELWDLMNYLKGNKATYVEEAMETLKELVIFFEGMKIGAHGKLAVVDTAVLKGLRNTIGYLNGDELYYAERDE